MNAPPVTVLCGSLSRHPVPLGSILHRAGYEALGLDYAYVPFAVVDLEGALRGMRALGIRGLGVSMPFKVEILPLLDRVDPMAARIGAVNTVVNEAGTLVGHNTDAWGAARALGEATELAGRRAVLIGAGGAARAVAYALCTEGVELHVVNRTVARARALADHLRRDLGAEVTSGGLEGLRSLDGVDAVVNCSSAGMVEYGAESPIPDGTLRPDLVVMDIVYKPVETDLLRRARARGARTVHGGRMLLYQACRQFELYTGREAPLAAMDAALGTALRDAAPEHRPPGEDTGGV